MKDLRFDALIVASRPAHHHADKQFTDKVMRSLPSSEILSSSIRRMNVTKKETFMTKIKRLPAFALVAIVLGAALLVSGSAYAAYQLLWQKPEVHVSAPTKSISGRDEVAISLKQCGDSRLASRYELKRNATITVDQVEGVVKARCELDTIGTWAQKEFGTPGNSRMKPGVTTPYDSEYVDLSMATHIKNRDTSSITFVGLSKYNQPDKTLALNDGVRYFADGKEVKANTITENDPIVVITRYRQRMTPEEGCNEMHCGISGALLGEDLLAVVKLSLPFENYDQFAWQSLTERADCAGNPNDSCLTGYIGGIDLYNGAGPTGMDGKEMREIQGVVTELKGTSVVIKSSSGTLFTITTPRDVVSLYNANRASQYNNQTVKIGSAISVTYIENTAEHSKILQGDMLLSVYLRTEMVGKSDVPTVY